MDSSSTGRNRLLIFLLEFIYSIWQLPTFFRLWAPLAKPSRRFRNFRHSVTTVSRVEAPFNKAIAKALALIYRQSSSPYTSCHHSHSPIIPTHVDFTSKIDSRTFANICHVTWNKTLHENRLYSRKQSRSEAKPMKKSSHQATLHNSRHYTRMGIAVASAGAPKPNPS